MNEIEELVYYTPALIVAFTIIFGMWCMGKMRENAMNKQPTKGM